MEDRRQSAAHIGEPATLTPALDDDDSPEDGEIIVPMPGSAAEEFDYDYEQDETLLSGLLRGRQPPSDDRLLTPQVLDFLSMDFDGTTDSHIIEPSFTGLSKSGFTIEAWLRPGTTRLARAVMSYAVAGSSRVIVTACGPRPSLGVEIDGQTLPSDLEPRLGGRRQHTSVSGTLPPVASRSTSTASSPFPAKSPPVHESPEADASCSVRNRPAGPRCSFQPARIRGVWPKCGCGRTCVRPPRSDATPTVGSRCSTTCTCGASADDHQPGQASGVAAASASAIFARTSSLSSSRTFSTTSSSAAAGRAPAC